MKNPYTVCDDVTKIVIRCKWQMLEALIDTSDLERTASVPGTWYGRESKDGKRVYVAIGRSIGARGTVVETILLHRHIMQPPSGLVVDHINHNTLDNRRSNLRFATISENAQNVTRAYRHNLSCGVQNVTWSTWANKWVARLQVGKKRLHIGYFEDIEEAKLVVRQARAKHMPFSQEALAAQREGGNRDVQL